MSCSSDRVGALKELLLPVITIKSILVEVNLEYAYGYRDRYYEEFISLFIEDFNKMINVKTFKLLGKRSTKDLMYKLYYKIPPRSQRYECYKLKVLIPYYDLKFKVIKAKIRRFDVDSNSEEIFVRKCKYRVVQTPFFVDDSLTLEDHINVVISYVLEYARAYNLGREFLSKLIERLKEYV